jgi:1-acyl-sn-glycerol-3-phosphate acyltransferase
VIYWIGWFCFRVLLRLFGRWQVIGEENVPRTGPVILAANHVSFADPPTVGAGIHRKAWFMAKEELFRPPLTWLLRKWRAFPVRRGSGDLAALKKSLQILAAGEALVMFPEGTRQTSGELGEAEMGVGMIAVRSGAPTVPVFLQGTEKLLPKGAGLVRPARVTVRYGPPITFEPQSGKPTREDYTAAAHEIMAAIARLAGKSPETDLNHRGTETQR